MNEVNVESLLAWSTPARVNTANGPRLLRKATPTPQFWSAWRADKAACQAAGLTCRPVPGSRDWEALWWSVEGAPVASVPSVAVTAAPVARQPFVLPAGIVLSDEQLQIVAWFKDGKGNLVVRARAGTGKTFTIIISIGQAPERRKCYCVFGKENQLEAEAKITDPSVDVITLNALGNRFVTAVWPGTKPDNEVENDRAAAACGRYAPQEVIKQVVKLVAFLKNLFIHPTLDQVLDTIDSRGIAVSPEMVATGWTNNKLAKCALEHLELSKQKDPQGRISFVDQAWLPVAMGWVFPKYDLIVVDECQDMNLPQLMVSLGALAPQGRMCVVGDDWQAIYGFRGAAEDGLDMMKARLQAQEIGLTVTRRCGRVIVESAKENGPQDYQSAEGAHEGELANISENLLVPSLQVGDVVLSRSNAPLMPLCLSLLKGGTPGRIRGRDIGKQLSGLVKKMKAKSVPQFLSKITTWGEDQKNRFKGTKAAESMSEQINDQVATLVAVASGCVNVNEICERIENIFQDEKGFNKPCVWFSSTHKAKGLEWDRVFLIRRTYRPERQGEEARLFYVAQTRAKNYLCFVHEPSKNPEAN